MKVFKIISKSLKLILRSKTSLATTLLGPLLIIILVGMAFGNISQYSLNIGVYTHEQTELVGSFIEKLQNQSYKIIYYPATELCINDIKKGSVHTCLEFPDDFELGVDGANEIKFYVDESKPNIVAIVNDVVIRQLKLRTSEIASQQTSDVLNRIGDVGGVLENQLLAVSEILISGDNAKKKLDSVDANVEYLESSVSDSTDSVADISSKLLSLRSDVDSMNKIALEDFYDNLENKSEFENEEEDFIEDYNSSKVAIQSIKDLVAEFNTNTDNVGSYSSSITSSLKSAQDQIDDMVSSMKLMQAELAAATGNFDDIDLENTDKLVAPIRTTLQQVTSDKSPLLFMFPTLLVMVIMLVATMLGGTLVVMEKVSSSFFRNFVTPTHDFTFVLGTFITNIIVVFTQIFLILVVASFAFDANIFGNITTILVSVLIIASLFSLLGMMLGYLVSTQEMVALGGIGISSLFIMLSGVLFPLENMPAYMTELVKYNPVLLGESILRKSIVFETPLLNEVIMRDVFLLIGFVVLSLLLVLVIQKIKKELFLSGANILKKKKIENIDELEDEAKKKSGDLDYLDEFSGEADDEVKDEGMFNALKNVVSKFKKPVLAEEERVYSPDALTEEGHDIETRESEDGDEKSPRESKQSSKKTVTKKDAKKSSKKESKQKKSGNEKNSVPKEAPKKPEKSGGLFGLGKKETAEESSLLYSALEPHQYFVLSSGDIVKSFAELVDFLGEMDLETFSYHVAEDKNDFYLWIKNVLKSDIVAGKIKNITDPVKMAKVLKKFL